MSIHSEYFWDDAILSACYLTNRMSYLVLDNKVTQFILFPHKPLHPLPLKFFLDLHVLFIILVLILINYPLGHTNVSFRDSLYHKKDINASLPLIIILFQCLSPSMNLPFTISLFLLLICIHMLQSSSLLFVILLCLVHLWILHLYKMTNFQSGANHCIDKGEPRLP